jgi:hypothetical protein
MNINLIASIVVTILVIVLLINAIPAAIALRKEHRRSIPRVDRYLAGR